MCANLLKLNEDKTEIMVFGSRWQIKNTNINKIIVTGTKIKPVKCVCNIGVYLDNNMDITNQFFFLSNHILLGFIGVRITVMSYIWTIDLDTDNIYTAGWTTQNGYFYLHIHKDIFMLWGYGKLTYIIIYMYYMYIYIYILRIYKTILS